MTITPKLTTVAACHVARIDRDRFNEAVARGDYTCAPPTVPGRARLFDPDDMIGLWYFRQFQDEGYNPKRAGQLACQIMNAAKAMPDERTITVVHDYFYGEGHYCASRDVPSPDQWDDVLFSGTDIRETRTYRIGKTRDLIAHYTEEERSIIGASDE